MELVTGLGEPFPIRLRATRTLRVTNLVGALVIAAAGIVSIWGGFEIGLIGRNGWVLVALGAPFAAFGLLVAPGTQRLEVVLEHDQVTVHGYLGTRRIPRAAIQHITAYPSIIWTDSRGRRLKTPVSAFNVYRGWAVSPNPKLLTRVKSSEAVLREWALSSSAPDLPKD